MSINLKSFPCSISPVIMKCFGDKTKVHHCKVVLLDEQELLQEIQDITTGQDLLDVVFKHLNLMETAYFGLRYLDPNNQTHWLDPVKKVSKQLKGTSPFTLYFSVKFYAADPCKLVEEITRYQFFLQVKQDILQGRLPVAEDLAAELGAFAVQSELGDYDPRRHSPGYVSEFRFLTTQSTQLEYKIADLHKKLIGQVPSKAENCYLEKVKWLDMYGVDLHPVLGEDSIEYFLGLTPAGVIVLRNKAKVGNYFWPRIAKVYFRGRFFMLRVRDKNNAENTYGFETPSKGACKHLWQCCVEHHAFFRLTQATGTTPQAIFSLGSQFRYSGRTEKEVLLESSQKSRDQPEFSRVPSRRFQRKLMEGSSDIPRIEDGDVKPETRNIVSLGPTPVSTSSHMYRSKSLTLAPGSDSPRSTRSAPYPRGLGVGDSSGDRATLLSPNRRRGESPHSTRSTPANTKDHRLSRRTSSVDSQSSVDSRGHRRHSHRRSRGRSSDGEGSECSSRGSKGSSRGNRRHRHRNHSDDSDQHGHRRHRRRKKDRSGSGTRSMVDSSEQWMAVQAKQAAIKDNVATTRDISHKSGYTPSGHETEADSHHHHSNKRRHRKHRSRSRSPSEEKKSRIPESIRKHLDFGIQSPGTMTEAELREIPYTKVETAKTVKIKYSDSKGRSKHKSPRRSKSNNSDRNKDNPPADGESPPPPYTPAPSKNGLKSNHKAGVEEGGGHQLPPEEGKMVNGYHYPPPSTRSALVKTPDQELEDSMYRATPTRLTNDNHSYRYTNGSHKPVMVNGPSVKALVTNSVGSSPSFNHDSPSPPPFRDDGSNSSFASGSGFTTPNMMKNGANDRNHFSTVLKPHPSPQSSVTSGISLGSSSTSTAVTGELGIPYEYVPASSGSPGGSGTDSSPVPPPRPPYPSEFAHKRGTSPTRKTNGYVNGLSNGNWKDGHSNGHVNQTYMNGINGVTIGNVNSLNSSEKLNTLNNKHRRHNGYTFGNNKLITADSELDIESRNNKNVSFSLESKNKGNSNNKVINGNNIISIHHDDIKQVEISGVNVVEGKRTVTVGVKGKVADEISTNL